MKTNMSKDTLEDIEVELDAIQLIYDVECELSTNDADTIIEHCRTLIKELKKHV